MFLKQVSVFLENADGRLGSALNVLKNENINIISLSLADTTEFGMLRMIVSDPEKAKTALKSAGLSAHLTDVFAIKLPHVVGSLQSVVETISKAGINIEYMYALSTKDENACIVIKPADKEACAKALEGMKLDFVTDDMIKNF
ncbi:MAG: amino acid-binding protein [Lachnospiraceae bacterium]|nr:amino acid-binding protein [Lachnospiraceae bacterium]MBO7599597.1 amino acid-binding protein [Lachnospiraceae bacterium]